MELNFKDWFIPYGSKEIWGLQSNADSGLDRTGVKSKNFCTGKNVAPSTFDPDAKYKGISNRKRKWKYGTSQ